TYFHAYPNRIGGVTVQYWRFYSYNTSYAFGFLRIPWFGNHGGDWEAVFVILSADRRPRELVLVGHSDLKGPIPWSDVPMDAGHPVISVGKGGHTSERGRPGGVRFASWEGPLMNLGERTRPLLPFLRYAGLWGARQHLRLNSGYWGP